MNLSAQTLLLAGLRDLRRSWLQLTVADLMARLLGVVVLTPLVGLLLKVFLTQTAEGVVTDGAIVTFLLHPAGLIALLVVASVSLTILFVETGQLMVIGFGVVEDRHVTWLEALRYTLRHGMGLLRFAGFAVTRLLLIALPFLAMIGGLYALFLRSYDINYYLTQKPPVFVGVVIVAGLLLVIMTLLVFAKVAGWLLVPAMVLFEAKESKEALEASVKATVPHRPKLVAWMLGWLLGLALLCTVATFLVSLVGDALIPRNNPDLAWLMVGLTAALLLSGLANLAVSIFATTLFPLCIVRLYRVLAGPGALEPEIAPRGSLGRKMPWSVPGKAILAGGVVVLSGMALAGYSALRQLDAEERAVIVAHRGGAAAAPENTMAAFERGIADGADWLELDVQEDADGVVVVGHDRDFMRVAGSKLEVWKATRSELAGLDIGTFFDPRFSDQRVPTLREVLESAKGKAGIFIELKYYGHDQNLEARVVEVVEQTAMTTNIVVMSLEYAGVRKTAALRPEWTYGLLNAVALGDLTRLEVDFLALNASAASYATIRRAHERGMKVYAWTVNDPIRMSVMMSRGVDGIITDRVALAQRVKELRATLTPLGRFLVWMAGETGVLRSRQQASPRDDA